MKKPMSEEEAEFEAEHDLRTLIEAEKIKRDEGRMKKALERRDKMRKDMEAIDTDG